MSLLSLFTNNKVSSHDYKVGQEWHYRTRRGEENSILKIVKIEHYEDVGRMIHIAILGLRVKHPKYPNGLLEEVLHLPMAEDALRNSTTKLINDRTDLPDYEFGYVRWKTAYEEDKAGYFAITVNEAVNYLEESANR